MKSTCLIGDGSPTLVGNHGLAAGAGRLEQGVAIERVVVDLLGELGELLRVGRVDERDQAVQLVAVVLEADGRRDRIDRPLDAIGPGADALAAGDDDALAVGRRRDERRIPAGGQEAERPALAAFLDVDDRDRVVVGVGHVERLAIGRQGERVRRAAGRGLGAERRVDDFEPLPRLEIERDHVVGVAAGDEEAIVGGQDEVVRMRVGRERAR